MNPTPKIIKHLIVLNVIMFIATMLQPVVMYPLFAMHFPENPMFRPWQIITHMFMHGGMMHILFNMYALWAFGSPLVFHLGQKRFLWFYLLSGLGAIAFFTAIQYYQYNNLINDLVSLGLDKNEILALLQTGKNEFFHIISSLPSEIGVKLVKLRNIFHITMVGASGAIYGILVAFGIFYPNAKLMLIFFPYPIAAKYFIPLLILSDVVLGITNYIHSPIAHFAHVGGALTGLFLMWLWRDKRNEYYF